MTKSLIDLIVDLVIVTITAGVILLFIWISCL